ncbi:MAG TPA: hypothetical protein PLN56_02070 [Methanoregulaceae archaeon]|nr:MAG: hypothetical protein IPI71_02360 [Methanolinea sp.]HON81360.1 hypothetical protein [Methanoregulaceae archaeon]HPD09776.1 hypothetical protein [Methanoregulaceae archaeon]HRT14503.1 hypothetical protein [Methanoregulaceae archaeon]HRU30074.1 hypothetical protein [Methanoregulaceae archaeon]
MRFFTLFMLGGQDGHGGFSREMPPAISSCTLVPLKGPGECFIMPG